MANEFIAKIRLFGVDIDVPINGEEARDEQIRLFGVDIDVSINREEQQTYEMEFCKRLKSRNAVSKNWLRVTPLRFCPSKTEHKKREKLRRKKRTMKRRGPEIHEADPAIPSPDPVIPSPLLQLIEARQGTTKPVFLYQKRLTIADVEKHDNRLFVTKREGFNKFLSKDERAIVEDSTTKGLREIVGVDARGETTYKLGLTIWQSLDILVINVKWHELVKDNDAKAGDLVQIWGYREGEAPCFAINFTKA